METPDGGKSVERGRWRIEVRDAAALAGRDQSEAASRMAGLLDEPQEDQAVEVVTGDTREFHWGCGTFASRGAVVVGNAMTRGNPVAAAAPGLAGAMQRLSGLT